MQNTLGTWRAAGPAMEAVRLALFGSLGGAMVGAYFAVQIISIWLENAFDPRLLAAFGALFGALVGGTFGALLGKPAAQKQG